ncbi:RDD family protein [Psychrobacter jeotgali]|uniref:RDD family protein n=1 Tax=Psychrobacter jeotgali TaxID=179010 RepID=UPI0019183278|nr:RDD family protein [Psychrobacter jeotgali]
MKLMNDTCTIPSDAQIDNIAKHPTPEGLLLTLMPAGLTPRLSAWLIDFLIRAVIIIIVGSISAFFGTAGTGIIAIAYFLITWLYPVYFEVYRRGMTPGKKRQGIYVCHDDGTPISLTSSLTRNLLRVADFLPFGFAAGILTIMFTKRSQRLGDIVAGTLVVYEQKDNLSKLYRSIYGSFATPENPANLNAQSHKPLSNNNTQSNHIQSHHTQSHSNNFSATGPAAATFDSASALFFYPLLLNEQQALVAYTERVGFLSEARQQEIASVLTPLITTTVQSPAAQKVAVQQAVLQKARMIQGQPLDSEATTAMHSQHSEHSQKGRRS